jgi:hypothetical protein
VGLRQIMATGNNMSTDQVDTKARELLEIMKMWDISRTDSYRIARAMMNVAKNDTDEAWINPLKGTGLKIDTSEPTLADDFLKRVN